MDRAALRAETFDGERENPGQTVLAREGGLDGGVIASCDDPRSTRAERGDGVHELGGMRDRAGDVDVSILQPIDWMALSRVEIPDGDGRVARETDWGVRGEFGEAALKR